MLYGYPIEATNENWFHVCMLEILGTIHSKLLVNQTPPKWPLLIPATHRARLRKRVGLKNRLENYQVAAATLDNSELLKVAAALTSQNKIVELLSGQASCDTLNELPIPIHESVKDLFEFSFELLTELGIRDIYYHAVYEKIPSHLCPFCGSEYFDAPTGPREALDHYLAKSKYVFAGVNLCNLIPMGHKCNSSYKLSTDILYKLDGTRRRAFYPFGNTAIKISLQGSEPFKGSQLTIPLPLWKLDFDPDSEEATTWDSVFHIRERYQRDILDPEFRSWLSDFAKWCQILNVKPTTQQDLIPVLEKYSTYQEKLGLNDRAFIKAAVFRMLLHHCQQNNQRLINLLLSL